MNIKKIQELVELMNTNDLTEVEIEQEGSKIKLIKKPYGAVEQHLMHIPAAPAQQQGSASENAQLDAGHLLEIKSPMVGTFYRAASPDAAPYVQSGDIVSKGDVLCIVEAMKLMNEVKSEIAGKIVEIALENAEPVEFGQVMFLIEPL